MEKISVALLISVIALAMITTSFLGYIPALAKKEGKSSDGGGSDSGSGDKGSNGGSDGGAGSGDNSNNNDNPNPDNNNNNSPQQLPSIPEAKPQPPIEGVTTPAPPDSKTPDVPCKPDTCSSIGLPTPPPTTTEPIIPPPTTIIKQTVKVNILIIINQIIHKSSHSSGGSSNSGLTKACAEAIKVAWLGKIKRGQNQEVDSFIDSCLKIVR